jgi:uncharacterized protein
MLVKAGIPPMARALISGSTAQLLMQGKDLQVPTGALLVEAARDHPDGLAAAALIAAVAKLVPDVPVDPKPLEEEATQLEKELREHHASADTSVAESQSSFI